MLAHPPLVPGIFVNFMSQRRVRCTTSALTPNDLLQIYASETHPALFVDRIDSLNNDSVTQQRPEQCDCGHADEPIVLQMQKEQQRCSQLYHQLYFPLLKVIHVKMYRAAQRTTRR